MKKAMKKWLAILCALTMLCGEGMLFSGALGDGSGKNIVVEFASPTDLDPDAALSTLQITKDVFGSIWKIHCDVMDTQQTETTWPVNNNTEYWMTDPISNPARREGKYQNDYTFGKEGHRDDKCGEEDNWVIFVDENGQAISLYELNSGATGGTLPTKVYQVVHDDLEQEDIRKIVNMNSPRYWDYYENFLNEGTPAEDMAIGERAYWTTESGTKVWHHTGTPEEAEQAFSFVIKQGDKEKTYTLGAGDTITIKNLTEGLVQIEEVYNSDLYYIGRVSVDGEDKTPDKGTNSVQVDLTANVTSAVKWLNVITPLPTPDPDPDPDPDPTPDPDPDPDPDPEPEPDPTPDPDPEPEEEPETPNVPETPVIPVIPVIPDIPETPEVPETEPEAEPEPEYTLTIRYVDVNGAEVAATYTAAGFHAGDVYTVASPAVEGMTTDQMLVAGAMPGNNVTLTVFYLRTNNGLEFVPLETEEFEDEEVALAGTSTSVTIGECFE